VSHLFLVRHGQASFLEPEYDKLSALGETQARLLGEYWARKGMSFDRVYSGPRIRQKETAAIVAEAYRKAGVQFPVPVAMQEFDEYDGETVLKECLPRLLSKDEGTRKRYEKFRDSANPHDRRRNFERLFEPIIRMWVDGEIAAPEAEPWPAFCARVNHGLSRVLSEGTRGGQSVIFCSAGPIGVAMQRALNLAAQATLRVVWMSRNGSYSEFLYSGERFTLSTFNSHTHLDDPSLLTYR
jgi:broad specificity phosphatase PhoE